jgi:hypothetical protein
MTHLSGHDRSQLLLLPEAVDDYVGPDNPVRFIDAFVDSLDLAAASFSRAGINGYLRLFFFTLPPSSASNARGMVGSSAYTDIIYRQSGARDKSLRRVNAHRRPGKRSRSEALCGLQALLGSRPA